MKFKRKCILGTSNSPVEVFRSFLYLFVLTLVIISGACAQTPHNPGIQYDPEALGLSPGASALDINLNWLSDAQSGDITLARFFDERGRLVSTTEGTVNSAGKNETVHKVSVEGLQANTQYNYTVSSDGVNWSYEYEYKTAGIDRFSFAYVGDPQLTRGSQDRGSNYFSSDKTTAQGWKDTMVKIAAAGVDFIASAGDQVDNGLAAEYLHFFAPRELRSIPFAPAVGNHDRNYAFMYYFNLPNEQQFEPQGSTSSKSGQERLVVEAAGNYWYRFNNALFVVLNTSADLGDVRTAQNYIALYDRTLEAAVTANKGKYTWLFVQHHRSTRSIARHSRDETIMCLLEAGFEKLMDKYSVDFVLAGHDHVYARSYAMQNDRTVNTEKNRIISPGGVIYLTANTATGIKYYDIQSRDDLPDYINMGMQNRKPCYTIVKVSGRTASFDAFEIDSDTPIDSFTVEKR